MTIQTANLEKIILSCIDLSFYPHCPLLPSFVINIFWGCNTLHLICKDTGSKSRSSLKWTQVWLSLTFQSQSAKQQVRSLIVCLNNVKSCHTGMVRSENCKALSIANISILSWNKTLGTLICRPLTLSCNCNS